MRIPRSLVFISPLFVALRSMKTSRGDNDAFEPLEAKKQKGETTFVCQPCRRAKRKCAGGGPNSSCDRCVEKGLSAAGCVEVLRKKRGRKPVAPVSPPDERAVTIAPIKPAVGFEFEDFQLGGQQRTMMSLMLAYSAQALRERPGDIMSLFGLQISTYICVDVNQNLMMSDGPVAGFLNSYVVSACCNVDIEAFKDIIEDSEALIGRSVLELCAGPPDRNGVMLRALSTPGQLNRPFIRRLRNNVEIFSSAMVPTDVVLETTLFVNEEQKPQWVFMSIVDYAPKSSPLSSTESMLSSPDDLNLLSFGEDTKSWALSDDSWITDLGPNVMQIDDDIFDLSI